VASSRLQVGAHALDRRRWLRPLALTLLAGALACRRTPEPEPAPIASAPPATAAPAPSVSAAPSASGTAAARAAGLRPKDLAWDVPSAWIRVEQEGPLRLATYRAPRAAGDLADAELSVTRAGGSLEANVRRWKAQFRQAPGVSTGMRRQQTVHGIVVTTIELRGTYLGRGSSDQPTVPAEPPKRGYAMIVAIAHLEGAPLFFKLLGPAPSVDAARSDLDVLVGSFRPK
jgi:hypothetical protein